MDLQIPLNKLKFGHEDGEGINARVIGRDARLAELAANLHAHGQIENLVVKPMDDGFYSVANGNRRLAAFHLIHGETSGFLVNCTIHEVDETRAFEYSLATAITAEQLHPVDQYEAFARLEAHGKTNEEIARQYGLTEKQVRQALALGRLSPKIRQAWRDGTIKADVAKAFTLALDHKTQDKAFDKLSKGGTIFESYVKKELGADALDEDVAQLLGFVGAQAYRDAGGIVTEDLFGFSHIISDETLLKQMARNLLAAKCDQLLEAGWGWAEIKSDLPRAANFWPAAELKSMVWEGDERERFDALDAKLQALDDDDVDLSYNESEELQLSIEREMAEITAAVRARSFDDKKKKQLGCILDVVDGGLVVLYGIKKPPEVKAETAGAPDHTAAQSQASPTKPAAPADADHDEISQALLHRLSVQLTTAAATALVLDEQLAISVLLAAVGCYGNCGVKISVNGLGARGGERGLLGAEDMKRALPLAMNLKPAERITLLAQLAASALDFQHSQYDHMNPAAGAEVIVNAIDAKAFNAAARGAFDAKDYFAGVSKALSLKAIEEALGPDLARQQAKGGKAEIVAFAIENVPPTGWLPPQLRAKGYDGPPVKKPKLAPIEGGRAAGKPKGKATPAKAAKATKPVNRAASAKKAAKKTAKKR
ncbi:ParB/RepB/Spo0J family partition protein [Bradyrhizobium sp. SZCCHNS3002]|uniref:ParB/RepB/Spo0J family partition protein n=1 Tax=Bradyrhizobium sp. SZCCHNS3002 TaxID=3057310 RepID=UPI0028E415B5|nr:ParB N-terminal domain-containing protein [Bradyrhizobium sp. SZCCHNS3002]